MSEMPRAAAPGKERRHGRRIAAGHELFTVHSAGDWCVLVNGRVVDRISNKFAALDLVDSLAEALQVGPVVELHEVRG